MVTQQLLRYRNEDLNSFHRSECAHYVFAAYLGELILSYSYKLSKSLQKFNLSIVDGWCSANATVETLKSIRNDESFELLLEEVLTHEKRLGVNEPTLPRQKSQSRFMQNCFGYGKGKEAVHTYPKDLYRKQTLF